MGMRFVPSCDPLMRASVSHAGFRGVVLAGMLLGLVAACNGFCKELSERHTLEIAFRSDDVPGNLPDEVSLCLFRVLQEALHNAVRHSQVHHFKVELRRTDDVLYLTVRDAGVGFDVHRASRGAGLGLISMRERMKLIGGDLRIDSHAKQGTTVTARAPVG